MVYFLTKQVSTANIRRSQVFTKEKLILFHSIYTNLELKQGWLQHVNI